MLAKPTHEVKIKKKKQFVGNIETISFTHKAHIVSLDLIGTLNNLLLVELLK